MHFSTYTMEVQNEAIVLHPNSTSDQLTQIEIIDRPSAYPIVKWAGGNNG